jgi:dipeptidyl aminopeptidase/acylaminoacyl peptidase
MENVLEEIIEKNMLGGVFKEKKIIIDRLFLAGHSYGGATAL